MFIVFDWDGTLADSRDHIVCSLQLAIRSLGFRKVSDEECASKIGLGLRQATSSLYPGICDEDIDAFCAAYSRAFLSLAGGDFPLKLFDGVEEALESLLGDGHQLAIATGKSRKGLNRVLGESRISSFFCASRTADETASKPDPLMLSELLAETGNHPQNTIMVGDTSYDLDMARMAGVPGIGVLCGVHNAQILRACDPMIILNAVSELPGSASEIQQRLAN